MKALITTPIYHNEKSYADLIACISNIIKKIIYKVQNSSFYDIMIDESTNISISSYFIIFTTIIEKIVFMIVFWGLLDIKDEKNVILIFEYLINHLKFWKLDLCNCMTFGNNGASTMVGSHGGVATILKTNL